MHSRGGKEGGEIQSPNLGRIQPSTGDQAKHPRRYGNFSAHLKLLDRVVRVYLRTISLAGRSKSSEGLRVSFWANGSSVFHLTLSKVSALGGPALCEILDSQRSYLLPKAGAVIYPA